MTKLSPPLCSTSTHNCNPTYPLKVEPVKPPALVAGCLSGEIRVAGVCKYPDPVPGHARVVMVTCDQQMLPDGDQLSDPLVVLALVSHRIFLLCR